MSSAFLDGEPASRGRLALGLVAIAVLVVGIVLVTWRGIWRGDERRITECGFDANGPYAKVRITSLGGGLPYPHAQVVVGFTYDGLPYTYPPRIVRGLQPVTVDRPIFGTTTTIVRGIYLPRVPLSSHVFEGRSGTGSSYQVRGPAGRRVTVEGRLVYRDRKAPFSLLSERFLMQHPRHPVNAEVVPRDLTLIGCTLPEHGGE